MSQHLRILREIEYIPSAFSARKCIDILEWSPMLVQITEPSDTITLLHRHEASVLRRTLEGRTFSDRHFSAIQQEIYRLSRLHPKATSRRTEKKNKAYRAYVQEARERVDCPEWIDRSIDLLHFHRSAVERETKKQCRHLFLEACIVAFMITPEPEPHLHLVTSAAG